ncbi:MAG: hypothetical protein L0Y54_07450 [Sporichthyaceae bacterium]|nr:hypothetical protein [Sporichthyaceae bacterium]
MPDDQRNWRDPGDADLWIVVVPDVDAVPQQYWLGAQAAMDGPQHWSIVQPAAIGLWPRRRDEDLAPEPERGCRGMHVVRHRLTTPAVEAGQLGQAAIEEHRAGPACSLTVGPQLPAHDVLEEQLRIAPGHGGAANRDLVLDDGSGGFGRGRIAGAAQLVDQRGLAGAWTAGDDDELRRVGGHG